LIDGHYAVINTDYDAGKIRGRKNRNWNIERLVRAHQRNSYNQKNNRAGIVSEPLPLGRYSLLANMVCDLGFIRHLG
jgi:hypothetical protein